MEDIQNIRLAYGISQENLAVASEITQSYLSNIESGTANPTHDILEKIKDGLKELGNIPEHVTITVEDSEDAGPTLKHEPSQENGTGEKVEETKVPWE